MPLALPTPRSSDLCTTVRLSTLGLRHVCQPVSLMANSPCVNGPKDGDDGKRLGPRKTWVTPDPVESGRGRKPRGPSALDELLRRGRGRFGGGGGSDGGGGMNLPESARLWKWGVILLVLLWALLSTFHIVPPEKEGVVTRLGSYRSEEHTSDSSH